MRRSFPLCILLLVLTIVPIAHAAEDSCYPTSVTVDGMLLKKVYDLSPEADPAAIPRDTFEQGGIRYTCSDVLRQELPEREERQHTERVCVNSKSKDTESVLELLQQEKECITDDGLAGTLTLQLDSIRVETAGYGNSTKAVTATRKYPGLDGQDTAHIPKEIEDDGKTLTLESIQWQSEGEERYTATATYTGSTTERYVSGYTVTADYSGTVSRIHLDRIRYVALFQGEDLTPPEEEEEMEETGNNIVPFLLFPIGLLAGSGAGFFVGKGWKRKHAKEDEAEAEEAETNEREEETERPSEERRMER